MQKTEIVNVRLPKEVIKKLDEVIQKKLFASRSEAVRYILREYAQEQKQGGLQ